MRSLSSLEKTIFANIQSDFRIGPKTLNYLAETNILDYLKYDSYISSLKIKEQIKSYLREIKTNFNKDILRTLKNLKIEYVTSFDEKYPKLLTKITNPPFAIYVRGELPIGYCLAIVGARKISAYGRRVATDLAEQLVNNGVVVVSGLALGVDGVAQASCVSAGGKTIAVLGGGVNNIYPASNAYLARKIVQGHGAVISEFPPNCQSFRHHFPIRNRVIAGLSLGVIVVEAEQKSGSLITARSALEENREVFAVPGSIYSANSKGPHSLIKMGAKTVTQISDVLEELGLRDGSLDTKNPKPEIVASSKEEALILKLLSREPITFEELALKVKMESSVISSTLTLMEMKGRVRNLGGNQFVLMS